MRTSLKTLIVAAAAVLTLATPAFADRMGGDDIRQNITGKRIYLAVPFGGEFPLFYRRDGQVDGSGEALGLGRFMRPSDKGRWWVRGDRLCQQWETWYDGQVMCFELTKTGPSAVKWVRDNGQTGTARIGN
jgi:hypothetical protein